MPTGGFGSKVTSPCSPSLVPFTRLVARSLGRLITGRQLGRTKACQSWLLLTTSIGAFQTTSDACADVGGQLCTATLCSPGKRQSRKRTTQSIVCPLMLWTSAAVTFVKCTTHDVAIPNVTSSRPFGLVVWRCYFSRRRRAQEKKANSTCLEAGRVQATNCLRADLGAQKKTKQKNTIMMMIILRDILTV